jgi:hypothetical protein
MDWTFIYLMFFLKLPIVALLWIVWWAVRQTPEPAASDEGGGERRRPRHPRTPFPRTPRRGPHGDPLPPAPQRARATVARAHQPHR